MEDKITISMEEYKELLITKGRYEELKSSISIKNNPITSSITYNGVKREVAPSYGVGITYLSNKEEK